MEQYMSEYADIIIPFLGVVSAFLAWMQYRTQVRMKEKDAALETIENKQIKTESEAANTKAQLDILRDTVAGNFENQKAWQQVMNNVSDRRREDNKELSQSLNRLSTASENLTEMLEIQSDHLGRLDKTVQDVEFKMQGAVTAMEKVSQENRHDLTKALELGVSFRTAHDDGLRSLQVSFTGLRKEVLDIISRREEAQNLTLKGVEAKFQAIDANISALIAPRPVTLGDTIPLPAPETWDEDTEVTANIPPNPHDDESDNPLLDTA